MTETIGITIVSTSFLPRALVLARSWAAHHDGRPLVVVHEATGPPPFEDPAIRFVPTSEIVLSGELARLRALNGPYTPLALKPWALLWALDQGAGAALYLDADGAVYADLDEVGALAAHHGFVVTPHLQGPGDLESERTITLAGTMNAGFIGAGPAGRDALLWWARRCAQDIRVLPSQGIMADQRWLDLLLGRPEVAICHDPGVNLHWPRLLHDDLGIDAGGAPLIGEHRVRYLHTGSSFHPDRPWTLGPGVENHGVALDRRPHLRELLRRYAAELLDANFHALEGAPAPGTAMADGTPIDDVMRDLYRAGIDEAQRTGEAPPPGPCDPDGGVAFQRWLRDPVDRRRYAIRASRYLVAVAGHNPDLAAMAPAPTDDRDGVLLQLVAPLVDERAVALLESGLETDGEAWPGSAIAATTLVFDAEAGPRSHAHLAWAQRLVAAVDGHVIAWWSTERARNDPRLAMRMRSDVWVFALPPERLSDASYDLTGLPRDRHRICWWPDLAADLDPADHAIDEWWVRDDETAGRIRATGRRARVMSTPLLAPELPSPAAAPALLALVDLAEGVDRVETLLGSRSTSDERPALHLGVLGLDSHPAERTHLLDLVAAAADVELLPLERRDVAATAAVVVTASALLDDDPQDDLHAAARTWALAAGVPLVPSAATPLPPREPAAAVDTAALADQFDAALTALRT